MSRLGRFRRASVEGLLDDSDGPAWSVLHYERSQYACSSMRPTKRLQAADCGFNRMRMDGSNSGDGCILRMNGSVGWQINIAGIR